MSRSRGRSRVVTAIAAAALAGAVLVSGNGAGASVPTEKVSFGALDQIPPMTMPTALDRFGGGGFTSSFVLDWVLANSRLRAVSAASPHLYIDDVPPSDHWPVQAVYELTE